MDKISKDKEVILVCRSGGRSNKAATILSKKGYTKVSNMEGGIMAWSEAGFATVKNGAKSQLNTKSCSPADIKAWEKGGKDKMSCTKAEKEACKLQAKSDNKKTCCSSNDA